jgi:hypothetical protein
VNTIGEFLTNWQAVTPSFIRLAVYVVCQSTRSTATAQASECFVKDAGRDNTMRAYITHYFTDKHRHWIRFADSLEEAEASAIDALTKAYGDEVTDIKTEECDNPTRPMPTKSELAQAGIGTTTFYVGPFEFAMATGLANDLRRTGLFGDIEIIRQGRKYNLVELE